MSKTKFHLVVVKSKSEQKYFVGKIPVFLKLKNLAILRNFIEFKGKDGSCPYKKLIEYVNASGGTDNLENFSVACHQIGYDSDNIGDLVYNTQKKLIDKYGEDCILNDVVINPAKYQCGCGKMIREQFREKHEKEYCILSNLELDFLIPV